jgi:hypothetical protein
MNDHGAPDVFSDIASVGYGGQMASSTATRGVNVTAVTSVVNVLEAVRSRHGAAAVHGVTRNLIATAGAGWMPAGEAAVPAILASARDRWPSPPHVAAALAWKSYAYGAMLASVLGFAATRTIPVGRPLVRVHGHDPFVEFAVASPVMLVLADDPAARWPSTQTVATEAEMLARLRTDLLEAHLLPVLDRIHAEVRVGRRTLLGSVASGICHALSRASDVLPGSAVPTAYAILTAFDLADLVDFAPDATGRLVVSRRTCCLGFALDQPKICSGCCLPPAISAAL